MRIGGAAMPEIMAAARRAAPGSRIDTNTVKHKITNTLIVLAVSLIATQRLQPLPQIFEALYPGVALQVPA